MPRASKRVAARQAELSRKKKQKAASRVAVTEPLASEIDAATLPAVENGDRPAAQAAPARPRARVQGDGEVSFRVPTRARTAPVGAVDASRRALPQLPYLRQDLLTLGIVSGLMVLLLVVLSFVLG